MSSYDQVEALRRRYMKKFRLRGSATCLQREAARRAAEMVTLAARTRAKALAGEHVHPTDLWRLDMAASAAVKNVEALAAGRPSEPPIELEADPLPRTREEYRLRHGG